MHHFNYRNNRMYCEDVSVAKIAEAVGTPFYLYSHATLRHHFLTFETAFEGIDHLVCFSAKANSNKAVLKLFGDLGAWAVYSVRVPSPSPQAAPASSANIPKD